MRFFQKLPYLVRILLIATIVCFAVVSSGALLMRFSTPSNSPVSTTTSATPASAVSPVPTPVVVAANPVSIQQQPTGNQVAYGHFPYAQADPNQLMIVSSYASSKDQRFESLNSEAGKALMKMIYAAREENVWIIPVSGFRSIEQQQKLFQDQIKRRGSVIEAAKISAPAGYSEHHTGFAVDVTDGKSPKQDITFEFEKSDAYRWLVRRGKEFGFELSFARNNKQGVSFEPWHWRYVNSPDAAAIFANARKS